MRPSLQTSSNQRGHGMSELRMPTTALSAGTPAPDFTLPSTPDQRVSLSDFRGRPVILAFYPAEWSPAMSLRLPVGERDHIHGPSEARVTLVEYGDYECPHCGAAFPVLKRVEQLLGDELRFVFRNFPLSEMHPHALQAAEAAEAAAAQGKFWNMHDLIFDNQRALGRP